MGEGQAGLPVLGRESEGDPGREAAALQVTSVQWQQLRVLNEGRLALASVAAPQRQGGLQAAQTASLLQLQDEAMVRAMSGVMLPP